ncbi:MAG: hypothetical protein K8W52_28035, partial [Deltaproteobacteria bacterium]|nr:hypothetical protein [Deltaproteobacteria bacterium]
MDGSVADGAGDDLAQGGLYTIDADKPAGGGVIRDDVFSGDTFDGATAVRSENGGSLASRVDALLAMTDDDDGDDDEGTQSVTGVRPLGSQAAMSLDPLDLQLGPAGVDETLTGVRSWPRAVSQPIPEAIDDQPHPREHVRVEFEAVPEPIAAPPVRAVGDVAADLESHGDPIPEFEAELEPSRTGERPVHVHADPIPEFEAELEPSRTGEPAVLATPGLAARLANADDELADLDDMIVAESAPLAQSPDQAPVAAAPVPPPPVAPRPIAPMVPPLIPRPIAGAPPPIPRLPGGAPPPIPRPPPRPPVPAIPSPPRTQPIVTIPSPPAVPVVPVVHVPPPPPVLHVPPLAQVAAAPEPIAAEVDLSEPSIPLDTDGFDEVSEVGEELGDSDVVLAPVADGMEPSSVTATVVPEQPIESQLEIPTVVERAIADLGEAALEKRAADLSRDLDAATERGEIAGLAYELGELFERRLADEARAVKAFGRALQTDPSLRANLWAIRRVFYRRGLWPNLIKLIDAELRFARSDAEKAELLSEKGLVQADRLGQPVEARATFEQAAALDPGALVPLYQLERLTAQAGDDDALAAVWAKLADAAERPERVLVYLLALVGHHAERGVDGVADATALLDRASALGVDDERVASERLRIAELSGDPDTILAALEAQAQLLMTRFGLAGQPDAAAVRAPGSPLDRATGLRLRLVAIRRRQAQIARTAAGIGPGVAPTTDAARAHAERAWDFLQQGLALAPGEALLLGDLADLAEELGRFDELAELVESWQALEGDPGRALMLSIRRADALVRSGQRDQARALFGSLEASAPGFLPITALIERDALGSGDSIALARAYASAADAARLGTTFGPGQAHDPDPASAAALFVAAAEVWAYDAADSGDGRPDAEARAALEQARLLVPDYAPANQALVALHERAGRIDPAAEILEREAAAADPDVRTAALERLARLYRDHGRAADAVRVEQRLLAAAPDDVRLAWRVDVGLDEIGDHAARIDHLASIARRDPDPARRGIALATAARLAEVQGDRARAIELHRATLAVWPADRAARAAIIDLLRAESRWDELVSERRAEAAELADGATAIRALREAAWVLEDRLGRPADAALAYRELLDRSPDDAHALAGLIRCRAAAGDRDGLIAALEQRLDAATGRAAVTAAIELALAQERAGRVDDALDSYRRALVSGGADRDVGDAVAAAAMVDLAVARGDTAARVEAMTALAQGTTSPLFGRALREDIGWLYALVLEDFDQAAEAFAAATGAASGDGSTDAAAPRGALLGAALIAARRADTAEMSLAYERLAVALREGDDGGLVGPTAA